MQAPRRLSALLLSLALVALAGCSSGGSSAPAPSGGGSLPQPNQPPAAPAPAPGNPSAAASPAPAPVLANPASPGTPAPAAPAPANPGAAPAAPDHQSAPAPAPAAPTGDSGGNGGTPAPATPPGRSSGDSGSPAPPPGGGQPAPQPPTRPAGPPREVSIILDWYPNAVHAFLYAAAEQGYFADEGLHVTFKMPPSDPSDGLKLVAAGKETFCIYYEPDLLQARAQDIPVVAVAPIVRHPLDVLMAPASLGLKSPKDLMGKTVGYPTLPIDINYVNLMVAAAGGDPSKVHYTDVGYDLIASVAAKQVDAIIGGYINHERLVLEKQGIPMTVWNLQDYGVPDYYELELVTSEKTASQDRAMVTAFWRAAARGFAWVKAHPDAAIDMLMKLSSPDFPLERDVETQSLQVLLPLMDDGGKVAFGSQNRERYSVEAVWLGLEGILPKPVDVDPAFISVVQ